MKTAGKILMWLSALPMGLAVACVLSFIAMLFVGEPSPNAALVPLFLLTLLYKPAAVGAAGFVVGFVLLCLGMLTESPASDRPAA